MYFLLLLKLLSILHSSSASYPSLPPPPFLTQFAEEHDRSSIMICIPNVMNTKMIHEHRMQMARVEDQKIVTVSYIDTIKQTTTTLNTLPQDLVVFVPDDQNDLSQFIKWFNLRQRTSRECWLLDISNWSSLQDVKENMQNLNLDLDDDLYWFQNSNEIITVYEVYRIHQDFDIKIKPYETWENGSQIMVPILEKWVRRSNLEKAQFDVVTLVSNPYITELIPIAPGNFEMKGMFAEVFFALQGVLNFTFVLTRPSDGQWGSLQSDGTWTGMVRELQEGKADIAVTDFTVTRARSDVITFAQPITQIYHSLFIQNPSGTFNYMAYIEPMKNISWLMIGAFCLFAPIVLFSTTRLGNNEPAKHEFTWGKSQVFVLSALTMRGWSDTPNHLASRCAFVVIMLAGIVIYYHWEAMLISYLSTRVIVLPFTNIKELVENSDFRIGLNPGSSYEDAFKYSTDTIWQNAYSKRIEPNLDEYRPFYERMIDLPLRDESLALYDNFFAASSFPEYKSCQVIVIPTKYDFKPYAYGFQKDSPYLGLFNHYLKEMREKGALKQILNKYESGAQACPDESGKPLGFESCFTAFLALLFGFLLGFILLLVEHFPRWGKYSIPLLDTYDRRNLIKEELESYEEQKQIDLIMAHKNAKILSLQAKLHAMQMKLNKNQKNQWYM